MPDALAQLDGVNGQLTLYSDKIVIKRKGALSKMTQGFFKGDKTIYLKQITSIQVKPASSLTNGYIQFSIPGGNENTKGLISATQDENTVVFAKKHNSVVEKIKDEIERLQSTIFNENTIASISPADELKKFKALLDEGILTQEEFDKKKAQLLNL
ncbi:SHOCT domain-containing protein [Syntrophomonas curvata]